MERVKKFFFSNVNTSQIVVKNAFWMMMGEVVMRLLKMALIVYAARKLGANGWGIFSYAISISSLFMIFADIGISSLITREASKKDANYKKFVSASVFLKGAISLISLLLTILVAPYISSIEEAKFVLPIIAFVLFFDSMRDMGFALNRAMEKMERETLTKTIMGFVILISGFILIKINPVPKSLAIAYLIGSLSGFLSIIISLRKNILEFAEKINIKDLKVVLKVALPFAVIILVSSILANTDVFMLGIWRTPEEIGIYTAAQRFYQFIMIIPAIIVTATLPAMSRLVSENREKLEILLNKTFFIFMSLALPIAIGGLLLMNQIIPVTFGQEYLGSIPILNVLMVMLIFSFSLLLLTNLIFVFNKQNKLIKANIFGVVFNVFINAILIPRLGAFGAIIATLVSTIIITFIMWKEAKKLIKFRVLFGAKKVLLPVFFIAIFILIFNYLNFNIWLNIVFSSLIYIGVMLTKEKSLVREIREMINV